LLPADRWRSVPKIREPQAKGTVMPSDFLEVQPRDFRPKSIPGLTNEARDSVNAALKAMSAWRNEIADTSERNGKRVVEKMAAAAAALGWPEQIVSALRAQLQSVADMQIKTMDHMMDAWEEQIKSPGAMTGSPSAMISKLKTLPGLDTAGSRSSADAFQKAAMNPLQFWMQLAEQSQKSWTDMMSFWSKAGKPH
jgi:ribonuclease D